MVRTARVPHQSSTEEHDRDGNVFQVLRRPGGPPGRQMLQEHVRGPVQKDHQRLHELRRRDRRLPGADDPHRRSHIPRPAVLDHAAHPPAQGQQTVPEENAAFDGMRQPVEYVASSLGRG